jgi:ligand-binding sensor domain-containing protein/DNA-binding CsgD family transcriptional regulator
MLLAQTGNLGLPPVTNFSKSTYQAGTQNWDIAQDAQGRLLFANNEGLLVFDGVHWQRHPISNGTCVRSVAIAPDGHIYVGGQGEIGVFSPDAQGRLSYQTLNYLITGEEKQFADVWDIVVGDDGCIYFRSDELLFQLRNNRIRSFSSGGKTSFLGKTGSRILVHDTNNGLMLFDGEQFTLIPTGYKPESPITALLPFGKDTVLITTLKNGIFCLTNDRLTPWITPLDAFLKDKRIYSAALLPNNQIALGISLGGLVVLGSNRKPIQWLKKSEGLQNTNVLSVFADKSHNLWLGLDNGIAQVEISSPFYRILPDGPLEGTGYAARAFENQLWLGTSNGLFAKPFGVDVDPFESKDFNLVPGTTGQAWNLSTVGGKLLLGHHEGSFKIHGGSSQRISEVQGVWQFLPMNDTAMVAGLYDGLALFTRSGNGDWSFRRRLNGLNESCRIMVRDADGFLWVSHPYRGVFRVRIRENFRDLDVQLLGKKDGLPSDLNNYVFEIGGKILVAADSGIFRFDANTQHFEAVPNFDQKLGGEGRVRYLREDGQGNIWFCRGSDVGVLWVEDAGLEKKIRRQTFPWLSGQLVGGFELIFPADERNIFFGSEKGFLHLDPERLRHADTTLQVMISSVKLPGTRDSLIFGGFLSTGEKIHLAYGHNTLSIAFSANAFGETRQIRYSYRLKGLDNEWSVWSDKTERDFLNLPAGDYVFWVKARNEYGVESAPVQFSFQISPPWYASFVAKCLYFLILLLGLAWGFRRQRVKFEQEKNALETTFLQESAEQQRIVAANAQEITRLRAEKLESEVLHKNQELALATMHLVQKGEILTTIQEALEKAIEKKQSTQTLHEDIRRIIRTMQFDTQLDEDWEHFAIHFDSVHGDFLKRLREQYPQTSPNDLRLCAYLRMNLSTKEIANLLNISVRGVEGSRYRLRKKLGLPGDANLVEIMMGIG